MTPEASGRAGDDADVWAQGAVAQGAGRPSARPMGLRAAASPSRALSWCQILPPANPSDSHSTPAAWRGALVGPPKLCPFPSLLPSLGPRPPTNCSCCTHRAGGPLGAQCFLLHGSRDHVPLSKGPYKGQAVEMTPSAPSAWGCLPSGATSDFVQRLKRPLRVCVGAFVRGNKQELVGETCILAQDSGHHTFICFEAMLESSRKARGSIQLPPTWAHVFFYCNKQCLNVSRFLFLWVLFIQKACSLGPPALSSPCHHRLS